MINKIKLGLLRFFLGDDTIGLPVTPYVVDVDKPPIAPPGRIIQSYWLGDEETDLSKRQTKEWEKYIQEYQSALKRLTGF